VKTRIAKRSDGGNEVQVQWDGRTVWVNDNEGMCIGRYSSVAGVDIHHAYEKQCDGKLCLDCRPGVIGDEGWAVFVAGMQEHHHVEVPVEAKPCGN
jgi:hypothetical protein